VTWRKEGEEEGFALKKDRRRKDTTGMYVRISISEGGSDIGEEEIRTFDALA